MIPPGATIGIMGGGQLGKMLAVAASQLGYHTHVYCPENDSPAFQVATTFTKARYDDFKQLDEFASKVDVVTFEFENVPAASIKRMENKIPVRPSGECLHYSQNRWIEKSFVKNLNIAVTPFQKVEGPDDITRAVEEFGTPCILKTVALGYDGIGQYRIDENYDPKELWERFGQEVGIVEAYVSFEKELSVILARTPDGIIKAFPAVENVHREGILRTTYAPANIPREITDEARALTIKIAEALDLVGLLAVEYFLTREQQLLFNEMAPRPHNSGHWSLDGAGTCQFEQHIRAICGLPLGDADIHRPTKMVNLIGFDVERWSEIMGDPHAKVYLYGKKAIKEKRKMGHVNYPLLNPSART